MTLKSEVYLILFLILEFVGVLLLLGLLAVKSLPAADKSLGDGAEGWTKKAIAEEIVRGERV
jgi:hypothetical protein